MNLSRPAGGKEPPKNDPTTIKTQLHPESQHKKHIGHPKASISGGQGDFTTESHRSPTIEDDTTKSGSQNRSFRLKLKAFPIRLGTLLECLLLPYLLNIVPEFLPRATRQEK